MAADRTASSSQSTKATIAAVSTTRNAPKAASPGPPVCSSPATSPSNNRWVGSPAAPRTIALAWSVAANPRATSCTLTPVNNNASGSLTSALRSSPPGS